MAVIVTCPCGKGFQRRRRRQVFCSHSCAQRVRASKLEPMSCITCGVSFPRQHGPEKRCNSCRVMLKGKQEKRHHVCACGACLSFKRKKCDDCLAVRRKLGIEAEKSRPVPEPPVSVVVTCKDCGVTLPSTPGRFLCLGCARQRKLRIARVGSAVRRARMSTRSVDDVDPVEIFDRDGWRCGICHRKVAKSGKGPCQVTLDHIIPLKRGGHHVRSNLRCAHKGCNSRKAAGPAGQLRLF